MIEKRVCRVLAAMEQQGLTRSQLADRMSESPFNRDEAGEIRAKRGSLVAKKLIR